MKKQSKIILIVFVIIVTILIVLNYFYYDKEKDDYLECTLNNKYSNYQEKLTFRFIYGTLYTYNREEIINSDNINEDYKAFEKLKNEAPNYEYFKYDIDKKGNIINVSTTIEAFYGQEFYNDYISELDLDYTDTIDEVKRELESDYTCRKYRK